MHHLFDAFLRLAHDNPTGDRGIWHFFAWCWHLVVAIFMAFIDFIEMIFHELFGGG